MPLEITPILLEKNQNYQTQNANFVSGADASSGSSAANFAKTLDEAQKKSDYSTSRVDRSATQVSSEDDDMGFDDFIDIINPLQHIPVLGTVYRAMTGDTIKPAQRMVGDLLYGAVTGAVVLSGVASIASLAIEQQTGEEPAMLLADALFGSGADASDQLADAMNASPVATQKFNLADAQAATTDAARKIGLAGDVLPAGTQIAQTGVAVQTGAVTPSSTTAVAGTIQLASAQSGKSAFGGVMAPVGAAATPNMAAQQMAQQVSAHQNMQRIGDKLVSKPVINRMARLSGPTNSVTQGTAQATAQASAGSAPTTAQLAQAQQAAMAAISTGNGSSIAALPQTDQAKDKRTLGSLVQQSVDAKKTGSALPPQLVQDMMMMALDKYKTAGNYAVSEMSIP